MRAWQFPAAVILILAATSAGRSQTCTLAEVIKPGDCFRYGIEMKLSGEMRFRKDANTVPVKLNASASHVFPERILAAEGAMIQKVARVYETARLNVDRAGEKSETTLRPSRRLVVAQRHKEQALTYSPSGALYRNELDLVSGHFDTLTFVSILPGKQLKVGETWKISSTVAQALCGLEGLTENKLEGKLVKVTGDEAAFAISGTATGVETGALVKLTIDAAGSFAVKAGRLTRLAVTQKAERDQGPVSPASTMQVTVTVDRKAVEQPADLSDVSLVSIPEGYTPPGPMTNLEFREAKDRFALLHTRDWHLTAATADHTVLRLLDRGDYVAQVTVTPWTKAKKGEHLSPEEFKKAMEQTPGWRTEKELQAGEIKSDGGRYVYRLSLQGFLDGVSVLQNFYLVASPDGDQVVLAFTLSPKQADKLGARDVSMAASIEVPAGKQ